MSQNFFSNEDRVKLEKLVRKDLLSKRSMARRLKYSPATIQEELKRNSLNSVYNAEYAKKLASKRRRATRLHKTKFKPEIMRVIRSLMLSGVAPAQIITETKKIFGPKTKVSLRSIYNYQRRYPMHLVCFLHWVICTVKTDALPDDVAGSFFNHLLLMYDQDELEKIMSQDPVELPLHKADSEELLDLIRALFAELNDRGQFHPSWCITEISEVFEFDMKKLKESFKNVHSLKNSANLNLLIKKDDKDQLEQLCQELSDQGWMPFVFSENNQLDLFDEELTDEELLQRLQ